MTGGFIRPDPPLIDERLHERMITGDLVQIFVSEQVCSRIADVDDRRGRT